MRPAERRGPSVRSADQAKRAVVRILRRDGRVAAVELQARSLRGHLQFSRDDLDPIHDLDYLARPMSSFDSTKTQLSALLKAITEGRLQLPDFQRGWVWDDRHIQSLLVSIARSFPIGAVMLLETGGPTRFQVRPVEGVRLDTPVEADELILDGQQRLTSLTQVLARAEPVDTRNERGQQVKRCYYVDIDAALKQPEALGDAIVAVDEHRVLRRNFGRDVVLDLSTPEKEIEAFHFPCDQILDSNRWEYALMERNQSRFQDFMSFRKQVLDPFRSYMLPVITLRRTTSKAAVCLVFEKVNTGGVALSVFELVTASWAADGYNLRKDWYGDRSGTGRHARLAKQPLLAGTEPTDFLQGICLLHSLDRREKGPGDSPVTAKREHVLELPLEAWTRWAEPLTEGFLEAERFLRAQGFRDARYLPYRTQVTPLAALLSRLGARWREPRVFDKIARWFWCGVLGELYHGGTETRIALDLQQLVDWIERPEAPEPITVSGASFHENRLDTLRTRTSAAYRGLYVLMQREDTRDLFWKSKMRDLESDGLGIDIHHIFPRQWCLEHGIEPKVFNAVVNKTAISYKANRMIGGRAPSAYLEQLQGHAQVQLDDTAMDALLAGHRIDAASLRRDDFETFYQQRRASLLELIRDAMGTAIRTEPVRADAFEDEDGDDAES
jgi:hypothetical protein